jgi:hypothetical protein
MRLARPANAQPGPTESRSAAATLGCDHPLARATERLDAAVRQLIAVGLVLAAGVIASCAGVGWAPALALSAGVVLVGLSLIAASYRQRESDCALALILQGRERLPVSAIQRQRHRLTDPCTRQQLAVAIETIIRRAGRPPRLSTRGTIPLFDVRVVAAVIPELTAVAARLRGDSAPLRGVARAERLVADGRSPLYGHSVEALRDELQHVMRRLDM